MNPVFQRLNELIPIVKQNRITMNQLVDYSKLFNCSRLEEPIDMYPDETPEKIECSLCESQATREVTYLKPSGKSATLFLCPDCYYEDGLWNELDESGNKKRQIIKTSHL